MYILTARKDNQMPPIIRRIIIIFAAIVFLFFIALIIAAWSLGAFDSVAIAEHKGGPYYFISFDSTSVYKETFTKIQEIKKQLDLSQSSEQLSAVLVLKNPMITPLNEVPVLGGLIISDSIDVKSPLHLMRIAKRDIVSATLEANPTIAIFKTYPALAEWLRKNDRYYKIELPFLEIYYDDRVTVEMPIIPLN
jgi:hypothetical protein